MEQQRRASVRCEETLERLMSDPTHFIPEFGDRLQTVREHAGLTQTELARAADISRSTVSRIERGSTPDLTTAARLAHALGASLQRMVFCESYPGDRP